MIQTDTLVRRKMIKIDEAKCDGCGDCIPNCPEGALQIIAGKARLVSDLACDGLGACLGHCPRGAITIEEREAAPYDERQVMAHIVKQGPAVVQAHLQHLREHQETHYLSQALEFLREKSTVPPRPTAPLFPSSEGGGCPGARVINFTPKPSSLPNAGERPASQLRHWPIQLHLLNPRASHYQGSHLLLAADCVPFALAGFHREFLTGKTLAIGCPKLDEGQEIYREKLTALVDEAQIQALTVMIMQVPCCGGLLRLAQAALAHARREVPLQVIIVSLQGEILSRKTLN